MIHKEIKRFQINVDFRDDSDIIRIKNQYENLLCSDMRGKGYLRILDLDPAFSVKFNGKSWSFVMTIYGMYVGKRKAMEWEGISQWKLIPRIRHHTLKQS
jgi:bacillopeptidase F (M6 metalloprotease family)